jgi:purine-nucleoside/S-methyl-5'-thioadenosine phosphorylase / adenosine deaminase
VLALELGPAQVRFTDRGDGDMGHGGAYVKTVAEEVAARRRAVVDLPWTWLRQVHGDRVVVVTAPGDGAGERADAAVTDRAGCALAVLAADCAPVALAGSEGLIGVAHAGWRGLVAGVVERTVAEMRALGAGEIEAVLGPCIRPECYEFGADDLDAVAARLGAGVRGRTAAGASALDLPAGVVLALGAAGVTRVTDTGVCTACSARQFSWRRDADQARQALVVWR